MQICSHVIVGEIETLQKRTGLLLLVCFISSEAVALLAFKSWYLKCICFM